MKKGSGLWLYLVKSALSRSDILKDRTKRPTVTVANMTGRKRSGFMLFLRRCICEIKQYRPKLKWKKPRRKKAGYIDPEYTFDISVIVCTYNRPEKLKTAVNSLIDQTLDKSKYEIVIVNNGEELPEGIESAADNVRVVKENRKGLSYARNTGGKCAKGRYLVYVDDDIRADENLLERIYNAFSAHKNIGIVGGQIILVPPSPRPEIILEGRETVWSEYTVGYKNFREISRQYEFPYGANFSVEHSVFDSVGGFDTSYGRVGNDYAGGEETAMCFRVLSAGYKIGIEPGAIVYHHVDSSRYTPEHVRKTIRAGIFTTYRLYKDGYSSSVWNRKYIGERVRLSDKEIDRLIKNGAEKLEVFYKECERDAFKELAERIDAQEQKAETAG